jgi:hypothetical protein
MATEIFFDFHLISRHLDFFGLIFRKVLKIKKKTFKDGKKERAKTEPTMYSVDCLAWAS